MKKEFYNQRVFSRFIILFSSLHIDLLLQLTELNSHAFLFLRPIFIFTKRQARLHVIHMLKVINSIKLQHSFLILLFNFVDSSLINSANSNSPANAGFGVLLYGP